MSTLIEILASFAILANGITCGTNVFGAASCPRIAAVDDRTLTHVHRIADRRSGGSAPPA